MSEADRIPDNETLLAGEKVEVFVLEALVKINEAIGLLEKCSGWNRQTSTMDDVKVLRDRLVALLKVMETYRKRIDVSK